MVILRSNTRNSSFFFSIETLYVPKLRLSLLSVGQLSATYKISFMENLCQIQHSTGELVTLGELRDGFWKLTGNGRFILTSTRNMGLQTRAAIASSQPSASSPGPLALWHQRLEHLHYHAVS